MKKIIFTGKGGVGKTTILSNLVRILTNEGHNILAIDCDPSMNLAMSLGIPLSDITSLAEDKTRVQQQLENELRDREHDEDDDEEHEHGVVPVGSLSDYFMKTQDRVPGGYGDHSIWRSRMSLCPYLSRKNACTLPEFRSGRL
ncbi:MAG: AAA family ATPase [Methanomicrobiales archaeon]|nr:AAA family ATPase [Methanomicrobiales archaeon]